MCMQTADVIIPVYNQSDELKILLKAFSCQTIKSDEFRLIIVDDGSTDELSHMSWQELNQDYDLNGMLICQNNKGRSVARNVGIKNSSADIVIFCDADRFPEVDFIERHIESHYNNYDIVVGASYEYFGRRTSISNDFIDWIVVHRFSRLPQYFKKITSIYDQNGKTSSKIAWLSFLVGNSSVNKECLEKVKGFDENFVEWGFEHFDIAYRLYLNNNSFFLNRSAKNYHLPHPRIQNFYTQAILKNSEMFVQKYPQIDKQVLINFISGNIDTNSAETTIYLKEK